MPVSLAYFAVVFIWSTTPLGIVWSSESVSPSMAVLLRMAIAVVIGWLIVAATRIRVPWHRRAWQLYLYSALGIVGGMLFTYQASRYLPSGMMSLIFGSSPFLSALLSKWILKSGGFNRIQQLALIVAVGGLSMVCLNDFSFDQQMAMGLLFIFPGVFFFSLSGVLVKSIHIEIHPLATTVGALTVSVPMFFLAWWWLDGTLPLNEWSHRSVGAIIYLGIFGSLLGFVAYYYVLQKLHASTVALVTLITPVAAIFFGAILNGEAVTQSLVTGATLIVIGLSLYNWGDKLLARKLVRLRARDE